MNEVLIVAPYASIRAGLRTMLGAAADCRVVGELADGAELARALTEWPGAIVLCDFTASEGAAIIRLATEHGAPIVVLGDGAEGCRELAESDLPGWAYLRKEADSDEIAGAIRAVAAGLIVLDRRLARQFSPPQPYPIIESLLPEETLTPREREVIQLMAQGLPNKNIAARLKISLHTVKFHVASILAKLNAASRTEAVTQGARRGLVTL